MNQEKPPGLGPIPASGAALLDPPIGRGPIADPFRGAVFTPSDQISSTLKRQVDQVLGGMAGKRALMVKINVETATGTNAVVAYKTASGFQAALWAGKSGWDKVIGVSVGKVWQ